MDDFLKSPIVLVFIGIALFIRILTSTEDDPAESAVATDNTDELQNITIQYLLQEIRDVRAEIVTLKSTRIESDNSIDD